MTSMSTYKGMKEWRAGNMSKQEDQLLSEFRTYKKTKSCQRLSDSKFDDAQVMERAVTLERKYSAAQTYICNRNATPAKKKARLEVQAAKQKLSRSKEKDRKKLDDDLIRQAIADLEKTPPDAKESLARLQKVSTVGSMAPELTSKGGRTKVQQKATYHYTVPTDWGYEQLRIVDSLSSAKEDACFLKQLKDFSVFLNKYYQKWHSFFKECETWDPKFQHSVRMIDGLRFEFMLSGPKGYTSFYQLIMFMNETGTYPELDKEKFRLDIIGFARKQMKKDIRTAILDIYQDEALIISSKQKNRGQNPHIDLLDPLTLQGGMIVTGGKTIKATYEYKALEPVVKDMSSFLSAYSNMPSGLAQVLQSTGDDVCGTAAAAVSRLLQKVGKLLSKKIVRISNQASKMSPTNWLKTGDLMTLPGNVIHAGPRSEGVRAVVFLVASNKNTIPYNADMQSTVTNTWATIAKYVWEAVAVEKFGTPLVCRSYLLDRIEESARNSHFSSATIDDKRLREFVEKVEEVYGPPIVEGKRTGKSPVKGMVKDLDAFLCLLAKDGRAMEEEH